MKTVCLWSGGKDSCFAFYKAKLEGYKIISLFNFTDFQGIGSLSHGLSSQIIRRQVSLLDIPLFQKAMPKETYSKNFKALISEWKEEKGIEGIIFGDIYLQEHKDWIDKVCQELEVKAVMPLWGRETKDLINEFIKTGFKAIVVSTRAEILDKKWLGREIDNQFIEDLKVLGNIDLCGERGEFHTFVFNGPIFKAPVEFTVARKVLKDKQWFLELI